METRAHNSIDYTGMQNNHLTALYFVEVRRHTSYWMFECKCGSKKVIDASRVKCGIIKSCGCWRDQFKPKSFTHRLYHIYKRGAEKRKYHFLLSENLFDMLISGNCYYCGKSPCDDTYSYIIKGYSRNVNGIDRKNNELSYTEDNCVSCCSTCNKMKMDMSLDNFINACENIVNYKKGKK